MASAASLKSCSTKSSPTWSQEYVGSGKPLYCLRKRSSLARSASSACLRSVMSMRRAGHAQQGAVGGVQRAALVFEPVHAAVRPDGSVRGERIAVLGLRRLHLDLEGRPVVWMDRALEGREGAFERPGRQSVERFRLGRPGVHVVDDVPVPGAHAGRLQRQPIALLAGAQGRLGLLASDELFFGRQPRSAPADALLQRVLRRASARRSSSHDRTHLQPPTLPARPRRAAG